MVSIYIPPAYSVPIHFSAEYIYEFPVIIRINNDYLFKQHQQTNSCYGGALCGISSSHGGKYDVQSCLKN
jgi:hypothetical protein